jgi:D-3-phosphoglycerate dehydrogenase
MIRVPTEALFIVKATSPGLDPEGMLQGLMPAGCRFEEFDSSLALIEQVGHANAFLTRSMPVTRDVIDAAPGLRLIQRPGVHVEAVDIDYASAKGIPVCHLPARMTDGGHAVAEHALFLILALAKCYPISNQSFDEQVVGAPLTTLLMGKTLGLVGIGRTGIDLIAMARSLGMSVIAVKRNVTASTAAESGLDWVGEMEDLPELLSRSDVVSIHLPLTAETNGFFGREQFASMKRGALFVNVARGAIVDRDALLEALASGQLGGVGLDVLWTEPTDPNDELLSLPNVVVTPHVAGSTREGRKVVYDVIVENVGLVAAGKSPNHVVNADLLKARRRSE